MSPSRLRLHATRVLAIFVATVCVTLLAPFVSPISYAQVCSMQGNKLIAMGDDGLVDPGSSHGDPAAHCPLCMPAGVPPGLMAWDFTPVEPLAHVLLSIPAARLAGLVGAPLPARGPPLPS